jgi:hypothetical protein
MAPEPKMNYNRFRVDGSKQRLRRWFPARAIRRIQIASSNIGACILRGAGLLFLGAGYQRRPDADRIEKRFWPYQRQYSFVISNLLRFYGLQKRSEPSV